MRDDPGTEVKILNLEKPVKRGDEHMKLAVL